MKLLNRLFTILLIAVTIIVTSCSDDNSSDKKTIDFKPKDIKENEALIKFLEQSGNIINSSRIPTLISAEDVYANLKNYLVIDVRRYNDYVEGHIDGAVFVEPADLISYMKKNVAAGTFEKIVLVCYAGHRASFSAMMLQMLGYSNVYSMKWGMCSWDKNLAESKWLKRISNKYSSQLETSENPKPPKSNLPEIITGNKLGYDILEARADSLLKRFKFEIGIDIVMENPKDYYIINYWPKYHYEKGHLPGSIQYDPKLSLITDADLLTLPTDKKIIIYDYTGQHACFVAAYLQVLGYDAYALPFGANSFMHSKLSSLKIGHAFNKSEIMNYPLTEGELPSLNNGNNESENNETDNNNVLPVVKKKTIKKEEGGC